MAESVNTVLWDVFLAQTERDYWEKIPWRAFRTGVEIHPLYSGASGMSAAFLKYSAGAAVPAHLHVGYEQIFVLQGEQSDQSGSYPAGTVVVNAPGSHHSVSSVNGCIVLAVWEKPVQFLHE